MSGKGAKIETPSNIVESNELLSKLIESVNNLSASIDAMKDQMHAEFNRIKRRMRAG